MKTLSQLNPFFPEEKLRVLRNQTPFFVFNKQAVLANVEEYRHFFPSNTEICYAMKANSERSVLDLMNKNGMSFELSSKYELTLLKNLRVPPSRIVFGAAIKQIDHIREFAKYGVNRFAFDNAEELLKIAKYAPGSKVYLRVLVSDKSNSLFNLSDKFGTPLENTVELCILAKKLGLQTYGLSFNVGSQARNEEGWANGIIDVAKIMEDLLAINIKISSVNIGGGFPCSYKNDKFASIEKISEHIKKAWAELPYKVDCIVEPGRGLVANAYVLITSVIAKNKRGSNQWLYLDGGVYNALNEALASQGSVIFKVTSLDNKHMERLGHYVLTGPTCDSLDVFDRDAILPKDLMSGERLVVHDVGAYSFSLMTNFNGFPKPKTVIL